MWLIFEKEFISSEGPTIVCVSFSLRKDDLWHKEYSRSHFMEKVSFRKKNSRRTKSPKKRFSRGHRAPFSIFFISRNWNFWICKKQFWANLWNFLPCSIKFGYDRCDDGKNRLRWKYIFSMLTLMYACSHFMYAYIELFSKSTVFFLRLTNFSWKLAKTGVVVRCTTEKH